MAANLSAVLGVYNSDGVRVDRALQQSGGFLPVNLKIGDGITATAAKDGQEVFVTLAANTSFVVPSMRTIAGTSPIRINGGASATLASDITVSIEEATTSVDGSMSAADKTKLDKFVTGSLSNDYAAIGGGVIATADIGGTAIEITFASNHNLVAGQSGYVPVHVRNIVGTTAANGRWWATITDADKIEVPAVFNAPWISGGDVHTIGGTIAFVDALTDGVYGLMIDLAGMPDTYDRLFYGVARAALIVDTGIITETTISGATEVRDDLTGGWNAANDLKFALVDGVISVEIRGIEDSAAAWDCTIRVLHATPPV